MKTPQDLAAATTQFSLSPQLVCSAEPQSTSQACLLAHLHKPGCGTAPSDTIPSLSGHSSVQERQARIPSEQPPVEDKLEHWASSDQELRS